MRKRFLHIGQSKYVFKRVVTTQQRELFETHIGAKFYLFTKCANSSNWNFYVRFTSNENKAGKHYNPIH